MLYFVQGSPEIRKNPLGNPTPEKQTSWFPVKIFFYCSQSTCSLHPVCIHQSNSTHGITDSLCRFKFSTWKVHKSKLPWSMETNERESGKPRQDFLIPSNVSHLIYPLSSLSETTATAFVEIRIDVVFTWSNLLWGCQSVQLRCLTYCWIH